MCTTNCILFSQHEVCVCYRDLLDPVVRRELLETREREA